MDRNGEHPYELWQETHDREYEIAYKAWIKTLTQEQFNELERARIAHPDFDRCTYTPEPPSFDTHAAPAPVIEPEPTTGDAQEAIARIIIYLLGAPNPRLELDVLAYVFGFACQMGKSGAELAAKYGISRAAFSKRAKEVQKHFNLRPSRAMKNEEACREYLNQWCDPTTMQAISQSLGSSRPQDAAGSAKCDDKPASEGNLC
jgi:hypothetical protein